jgi:uncharacterized integral membrane protein
MKFKLIIILIITVLLIIFAIQNAETVKVKLWFWQADIPGALLIVICIGIGILFGLLLINPKKEE